MYLAVLPQAFLHFIIRIYFCTFSVLLAIFPHAVIDVTICEDIDAEPILFVVRVLTFVASAVGPYVLSLAMHLPFEPLALVDSLARRVA